MDDSELGEGKAMSQDAVERAIGKLVTGEDFRERFFEAPDVASWNAGLRLSPMELQALCRVSPAAMERFSTCIDDRLRLLHLAAQRTSAEPVGPASQPPRINRARNTSTNTTLLI